jgi:hypothetical protein
LADIFWRGDKSPQKDAIDALNKQAVDIWSGAFHSRFKDGILELVVEMSKANGDSDLWKHFKSPKFMGHELHILKVPIGYIKFIKDLK